MSFWSTLASMFRTSRAREIQVITLEVWEVSGQPRLSVRLPPGLVASTSLDVQEELPDGTWRFCERLLDTTEKNEAHFVLSQLSYSPKEVRAAPDGSYEERLRAYYKARGIPRIFADLSLSAYTRD